MEKKKLNRLESLDVLRGFDLFCLVVLEMVLHPLAHAIDMPWFNSFMWGFSHVEWEGFSTWDLVMPLFLFMAGVSMPFSLSRYKDMPDKMAVYRRIGKRVVLLWVFGMMCQGNLLALDPDRVYLYSKYFAVDRYGVFDCFFVILACKDTGTDRYSGGSFINLLGSDGVYYSR